MQAIDKANGYIYGSGEERNIQRLLSCAVGAEWEHDRIGVPRDTFMKGEGDEEDDGEDEDNVEEVLAMLARQNQDKAWREQEICSILSISWNNKRIPIKVF